jgi:hypothetical protein
VGLLLGLAIVILTERLSGQLHSEREITALLGAPIIAEIPEITTPAEELSRKRSVALGWATGAVVVGSILVGSAISYLH